VSAISATETLSPEHLSVSPAGRRASTSRHPQGHPRLGTYKQAVLVLRWFLDDTRMCQLARDNAISGSTAYDYRDEGIAVLAARKPGLHGALLAAKAAGHSHVIVDGTLIHTDRIATPGPTKGVDLWWSGNCATRRCHFGWRWETAIFSPS